MTERIYDENLDIFAYATYEQALKDYKKQYEKEIELRDAYNAHKCTRETARQFLVNSVFADFLIEDPEEYIKYIEERIEEEYGQSRKYVVVVSKNTNKKFSEDGEPTSTSIGRKDTDKYD